MISVKQESLEKTWDKLLKYMIIIWFIASFITFILPLNYVNTNNLVYSYGTSANFTFLIGFLFEIVCFIFMLKNIKSIKNKKYLPIILYMIGGTIVMAIQKLNPGLLLMTSAETFVTFLMYFTIENPDMKLINELELAKSSAEKANRAKTEFLSSMSHEIRTPLNAIVGLSEIINKTEDVKEIHEDSKDVVNASYTLLEIVNSILDISKIEAGKMEIVKVNYNPRDEIQKLAKLLETRIGSKDLKLYVEIDNNLPNVLYGDLNKVKQIISNLLSNAIKYTESGRVDLKVVVENTDKICNLEIMVKDTGRGIKEEQLSHLFTKFDRLEADKNTSIEGTGLGLAITKSLVEMLGGTINVESTYGVGSVFSVTIPEEISDAVLETTETESITKYNGVTSLIVDDSKLNLKVAEKILSEYGLTTETVLSGDECIDKIKRGNIYDIIFMDIMMPNKGGVETLKELKSLPNFNTPVVALTADAMEGQKEAYLSAGFIAYLSKPIDRQELESFLKKELKDKVKLENTKSSVKEEIKPAKKENNKEEILTSVGLDLKKAYEFFMDIDTLIPQLKEYLAESTENKRVIKESYNKKDDINYEIVVHKLKSESRMLGLTSLGEMFYNHELAAKRKDWDYINKEYTSLINEYDKVLNALKNL
jgi:signal transduction histidine kinase/DNA-binding response OmpR family regulator